MRLERMGVCPEKYSYLSSILFSNTLLVTTLKLSSLVRYANDLICTFMNINENNKNDRKFAKKLRGCTYKIPIPQLLIALYNEMCYQINATTSMPAIQLWAVIAPTCFTQQPDMGCQPWPPPQQICNSVTGRLDIP